MKNFFGILSKKLLPVVLVGMLVGACKEKMEDLGPMRMFTPTGMVSTASLESEVRLTWRASLYTTPQQAVTYTVEVATDSLFATPVVLSVQTDTAGVVFTDQQLQVRQLYFARIRANALGDRPESRPFISNGFRIRGPQIFLPMGPTDVINNAAILRWRPTPGLTRLLVMTADTPPREIMLSPEQAAADSIVIENLVSNRRYTVDIFRGETFQGSQTFTTLRSTLTGTVVDLSGIQGRPSVLQDTLPQIEAGATVLLRRGMTYNISSTTVLDKTVRIMSGTGFNPARATLFFTSNFNLGAGAAIDSIVFRDVNMHSDNFASRYVFNTTNGATIGKLSFESVRAGVFRGLVRLQAAGTTINNFTVNNSVVDSLANYGVLTIDNVGSRVNDIVLRNSTLHRIERVIVSRTDSRSIRVQNVTVYDAPEATRYFIDYNNLNVTGGILVENTIFGRARVLGDSYAARGIRASAGTSISATVSYSTSDYELTPTGNFEIPGLQSYGKTSAEVFANPRNGDFRIVDAAFPNRDRVGDPRWR